MEGEQRTQEEQELQEERSRRRPETKDEQVAGHTNAAAGQEGGWDAGAGGGEGDGSGSDLAAAAPSAATQSDAGDGQAVPAAETASVLDKKPSKRVTEADKRKRREEERLRQEAEMKIRDAQEEQRKREEEAKMRRLEQEKLEKADFVYSGERDEDGLPDGMGRCVYRHLGLIYEGEFRHGIALGEGKLMWPNGSVYAGAVVDGRPIDGRLDKNDGETLLFRNGEVVRKETQFAFSMFTSKIIE